MTLRDYIGLLRDGWWWLVGGAVAGAAVGLMLALSTTPVYTSSITFYLAAIEGGGEPGQAYQGAMLAEQKARAYSQLLLGDRIRDEVSNAVGSTVAPDAISATAAAGTPVVTVQVRDPSPDRARMIADAVADKADNLVGELERPLDPRLSTVVTLRVVAAATLPERPTSPNRLADVVIGAVVGLLSAFVLALARRGLDQSLRTREALGRVVGGVRVLDMLPRDRRSRSRPALLASQPRSQLAEAVHQLRTHLQFACRSGPTRSIVLVTSPKAEEGRTSVLCNLAESFAADGRSVMLVDADFRRPRVADYLALGVGPGLTTVLCGEAQLDDVIQTFEDKTSFDVLPSGPLPPNPSELSGTPEMDELLNELGRRYELVLIDAPPLLTVADATALASRSDCTVLLARFGRTTEPDVEAALEILRNVSAQVGGAVLTMVPPRQIGTSIPQRRRVSQVRGGPSRVTDRTRAPRETSDISVDRNGQEPEQVEPAAEPAAGVSSDAVSIDIADAAAAVHAGEPAAVNGQNERPA